MCGASHRLIFSFSSKVMGTSPSERQGAHRKSFWNQGALLYHSTSLLCCQKGCLRYLEVFLTVQDQTADPIL